MAHFSGTQTTVGSGFYEPVGVAVDRSGNLYVADADTFTIYEILAVNGTIPASPTIRTLVRTGTNVESVAVDNNGNVYYTDLDTNSDFQNNTVKEILAVNGTIPASPITRQLGSGLFYPSGVAVDSSGDVYVADTDHGVVKEMLAINGSVPASPTIITVGSGFYNPQGLALDSSGDLYVTAAASGSSTAEVIEIMAVNGIIPASPTIRTLGTSFCGPDGVAVDSSGNVFVSAYCDNAVFEILAVDGTVPVSPTINKLGSVSAPDGVAVDSNGYVYVGGVYNSIPKIPVSTGDVGTVNLGIGSTIPMPFIFDTGGTLGSTAVLTQGATGLDFADTGTGTCTANTVYAAGQTCTVNVTFTPKYSGLRSGAVELKDTQGNVIAMAYLKGTGVGPQVAFGPGVKSALGSGFYQPWGVAVDASGNVFVADTANYKLKEIEAVNGRIPVSPTIKLLGSGFESPSAVAVDGAGNLFVTDFTTSGVYELSASSGYTAVTSLGGGFANPTGLALDSSGNVYVADYDNNAVKKIPPSCTTGTCVVTLGSGFDRPYNVAVDGSGNVFVTDSDNFAVKEILSAGGYTTVKTLLSGIQNPRGLTLDGNGNLFVSNYADNTVLELPAAGDYSTVTTVSGTFNSPSGLAVDGAGNLYIADVIDNQVLMSDTADAPSLTFANTVLGSTSSDSPLTVTLANIGNAALTLPIPAAGNNPAIAPNFTLGSSGASACPVVSSNSSVAGIVAAGASCQLAISFTPTMTGNISGALTITDTSLNATAPGYVSQSTSLSGLATQATPVITWPAPSPITYGTALSAMQLNATASVPGTFVYSPAAGTISPVGTDTLAVVFTPNDTVDYTTASASVALLVNPAPGFTLAASPADLSIKQGSKANSSISIAATGGFNGNVTLKASGLPSGVTAAFSPNPSTSTSTLTLTVSNSAKAGTISVTITGTSGSLVQTTEIGLTVVHK
jgi:sugar lactone lactonase YvrE